MMLEVKDLSVSYGSSVILDKVSFSVERGQWLMIVGPNGAGKTTVLGAVSQSVAHTGTVLFEGQNVKKMRGRELARKMGVLSQNHYVGYGFTVEEVIRLGRYSHDNGLFSKNAENSEEKIQAAIDKTGLRPFLNQSVLTLSGGELQRTFLAQLLAQDPEMLLLDEPTNHLDLIYQREVFALVQEWLKVSNGAVVSVVHDLSLAKAYGTHALLMRKGGSPTLGTIDEVLCPEKLNSVYGMDVYDWMRTMYAQWT